MDPSLIWWAVVAPPVMFLAGMVVGWLLATVGRDDDV